MGLGPPVCTKCERICDLMSDGEWKWRVASGQIRATSYRWWCSKCGGQIWMDEEYITRHDPQLAKHLWNLPKEEQAWFEWNSQEKSNTM